MDPINYTSAFADLKSPNESFMQGVQGGAAVQQLQLQQQQAQVVQQQKAQMQADLAALAQNPTSQAIGQMSIKYPQLSENFKRSFDMLEPAQKQSKLEHATQVYAALHNGEPKIAQKILTDQATALRNSGNEQDAKGAETMAALIDAHPQFAQTTAGLMISSAMGPEKFATTFAALGKEGRDAAEAPADLRKKTADAGAAESDATTKAVTAKYADQQAVADLEKKGWDVKAITADIEYKKQSNRIAAMNAAVNREGNGLKRQELQLKIDEAKTDRDNKVNEKTAKAESAANAMDNMLNTIQRTLKNPALNDVVGSIEGAAFYPTQAVAMASGLNPLTTSGDDRADAIALIETLGSQAFLSQVPTVQGMGSLSNAEGEKLQSALQNLSRKQSETQFRASLNEASRLVMKSRENISKRYGVPLGAADTPAVRTSRPPLESFNR